MTETEGAAPAATTKDDIVAFVREKHGGVSLVEITKRFGDGTWDFILPGRPNTIMWTAMRDDVVDAINAAVQADALSICPTTPFVYLIDGAFPRLPVAKRIGKKDYKSPHWLPVVLNLPGQSG